MVLNLLDNFIKIQDKKELWTIYAVASMMVNGKITRNPVKERYNM
jgi:hypothetical protein